MKTILHNHVFKTCTFVLLLASILLTACAPAKPEVEAPVNNPTPEIFLPLDPSPSPAPGILLLSCQFTDLKIYVNWTDKYCFAYPDRFQLNDQGGDLPLLQGPPVDASGEVYANLKIEDAAFDSNKSLDQQVDEFLAGFTVIDLAYFEHARVSVGGESAILVERARVAEAIGPTQMNWRIVFIPHGSKLYRLIYRPMDVTEALADLNELYQVTTVTFAFFK